MVNYAQSPVFYISTLTWFGCDVWHRSEARFWKAGRSVEYRSVEVRHATHHPDPICFFLAYIFPGIHISLDVLPIFLVTHISPLCINSQRQCLIVLWTFTTVIHLSTVQWQLSELYTSAVSVQWVIKECSDSSVSYKGVQWQFSGLYRSAVTVQWWVIQEYSDSSVGYTGEQWQFSELYRSAVTIQWWVIQECSDNSVSYTGVQWHFSGELYRSTVTVQWVIQEYSDSSVGYTGVQIGRASCRERV